MPKNNLNIRQQEGRNIRQSLILHMGTKHVLKAPVIHSLNDTQNALWSLLDVLEHRRTEHNAVCCFLYKEHSTTRLN